MCVFMVGIRKYCIKREWELGMKIVLVLSRWNSFALISRQTVKCYSASKADLSNAHLFASAAITKIICSRESEPLVEL